MPASGFVATKRTGFVLDADRTLNWTQAQHALAELNSESRQTRRQLNATLAEAITQSFGDLETVERSHKRAGGDISPRYFGPVFHTDKFRCRFGRFTVQIGGSITLCVATTVRILDQDPLNSQSKCWVSAIISSDEDDLPLTGESAEQLIELCRLVDRTAEYYLQKALPIYRQVICDELDEEVAITVSRNRLLSFVFEAADDKFRSILDQITSKERTLSQAGASKSLQAMDEIFSGASSQYFLKVSRTNLTSIPEGVHVDSFVANDRYDARAFVIETKIPTGKDSASPIEWRMLGATSGAEPHHPAFDGAEISFETIGLNPAHSISNELANRMGAHF